MAPLISERMLVSRPPGQYETPQLRHMVQSRRLIENVDTWKLGLRQAVDDADLNEQLAEPHHLLGRDDAAKDLRLAHSHPGDNARPSEEAYLEAAYESRGGSTTTRAHDDDADE